MRASPRKSECFTIPTKRGNQPEAMSRKGYWVVKQKTAADRFRRALKRIAEWCGNTGMNQFASSGQHSSGSC